MQKKDRIVTNIPKLSEKITHENKFNIKVVFKTIHEDLFCLKLNQITLIN